MMVKPKAMVIWLLASLVCSGARADVSLLGTPGGIAIPYARALSQGSLQATASMVWLDRGGDTKSNGWYSVGYGVLRNAEAGLSYVSFRTRPADDLLFHGKWVIAAEKKGAPAVAIGVTDLTGELASDPTVYVVASKLIWSPADEFTGEPRHPLWGHIGVGSGIYGDSPFAGVEWLVAKNTRLLVEWGRNLSYGRGDYQFHVGARYAINDRISVNAAAVDMRSLGVGVTARFDDLLRR